MCIRDRYYQVCTKVIAKMCNTIIADSAEKSRFNHGTRTNTNT